MANNKPVQSRRVAELAKRLKEMESELKTLGKTFCGYQEALS